MTGNEPSGPIRVGFAILGGNDTRLYQTEKRARYYAGFNGRVVPVYTLPDSPVTAPPPKPAGFMRLRWFLFGMAFAALLIGAGGR